MRAASGSHQQCVRLCVGLGKALGARSWENIFARERGCCSRDSGIALSRVLFLVRGLCMCACCVYAIYTLFINEATASGSMCARHCWYCGCLASCWLVAKISRRRRRCFCWFDGFGCGVAVIVTEPPPSQRLLPRFMSARPGNASTTPPRPTTYTRRTTRIAPVLSMEYILYIRTIYTIYNVGTHMARISHRRDDNARRLFAFTYRKRSQPN